MIPIDPRLRKMELAIAGEQDPMERCRAYVLGSAGIRAGRAAIRSALADELRAQGHARAADLQDQVVRDILEGRT